MKLYLTPRYAQSFLMPANRVSVGMRTGKISAEKNALGQWVVEPAELHCVYPEAARHRLDLAGAPGTRGLPGGSKAAGR